MSSSSANNNPPSSSAIHETIRSFRTVSEEEVKKLILKQPNKQSELDPLPTWLIKIYVDDLVPVITRIMNLSLSESIFPCSFKQSIVKPILKKHNLDSNCPDNYRPITNLSSLSKLLERIVCDQISKFLNTTPLLAKNQSAYRQFHSTETLLMRTVSDLISHIGDGELTLVSFLDMSAAFDTVDHGILLTKLEHEFGIKDNVLMWIASYLSNREYEVKFNNTISNKRSTLYGVPQGSVLGPFLFNLYTNQLESVIQHLGFSTYCYADDRILFKSCFPGSENSLKQDVVSCIMEVSSWMSNNMLKINPTKTEFLWIASPRRQHHIKTDPIRVQNVDIIPSNHVKFLGAYLDRTLSMDKHISSIVSQGFYILRQLKNVRKCLSIDGAKTLINSFIISRLDYCNGILVNLPQYQLHRVQSIFNAAARFIYRLDRYSHISDTLQSLHWLKCPERVEFKLCLTVFKALHAMAPEYISELCCTLQLNQRQNTLRSRRDIATRLEVTNTVGKPMYAERAFATAAPTIWNGLPQNIREAQTLPLFKNQLKTFLFRKSHNIISANSEPSPLEAPFRWNISQNGAI